jgi:hypothetical protein
MGICGGCILSIIIYWVFRRIISLDVLVHGKQSLRAGSLQLSSIEIDMKPDRHRTSLVCALHWRYKLGQIECSSDCTASARTVSK